MAVFDRSALIQSNRAKGSGEWLIRDQLWDVVGINNALSLAVAVRNFLQIKECSPELGETGGN